MNVVPRFDGAFLAPGKAARSSLVAAMPPARPLMFLYWGRRGLSRFAHELVQAANDGDLVASISVSRQNEIFPVFADLGPALFPVDTFRSSHGALTQAWRIPALCRAVVERLKRDRTQTVIDLMPHVWSPFIASAIKRAGIRYVALVHDVDAHPGDPTSFVRHFLDRAACRANHVIVLSETVAERLRARGSVPPERLSVLFHPDLCADRPRRERQPPQPGAPLRLLFLGRIMAYKGLPLFLDMVDRLRAEGVNVVPGVFGEGPLGDSAERLTAMKQAIGAEVVNRWLSEDEIGDALSRYDVLVASLNEASQSGVVASALGAGLPCVVTPVGGLSEQIEDGVTGLIAQEVTAFALAAAVRRLTDTPDLYRSLCVNIAARRESRSMRRFVDECTRVATAAEEADISHARAFTRNAVAT